jgi:hypothetical protein
MVRKETVIRANSKVRKVFNVDSSSVASGGRAGGIDMGVVIDWGKGAQYPISTHDGAFSSDRPGHSILEDRRCSSP